MPIKMIRITVLLLAVVSQTLCFTLQQTTPACPMIPCPKYYHAICGSDGRTYDNECYLKAAKCNNPYLHIAYEGRCGARPTHGHIICTTPMCMPTYEPVCGSDGITYGNGCHFSNAKCDNIDLKLAHTGPCAA